MLEWTRQSDDALGLCVEFIATLRIRLDFIIPHIFLWFYVNGCVWGRLIQFSQHLGHLVQIVLLLLNFELI